MTAPLSDFDLRALQLLASCTDLVKPGVFGSDVHRARERVHRCNRASDRVPPSWDFVEPRGQEVGEEADSSTGRHSTVRRPRERITAKSCLTCGACCWSPVDQPAYCDVSATDAGRLSKKFVRLNVLQTRPVDLLAAAIDGAQMPHGAIRTKWVTQKAGPFKGVDALVCAALRGSIFHRVSCSVYDKRPRTCRVAVVPGDKACRQLRQMFKEAVERA